MVYHFEVEEHSYAVIARAIVDGRYTAGSGKDREAAMLDLIQKQAYKLRELEMATATLHDIARRYP